VWQATEEKEKYESRDSGDDECSHRKAASRRRLRLAQHGETLGEFCLPTRSIRVLELTKSFLSGKAAFSNYRTNLLDCIVSFATRANGI
jgi:hypothetical protein